MLVCVEVVLLSNRTDNKGKEMWGFESKLRKEGHLKFFVLLQDIKGI